MTKNGAIVVRVVDSLRLDLIHSCDYIPSAFFLIHSLLHSQVDDFSQTSIPSIWAVGDVTYRINLTPIVLMEGGALANTLFRNEPTKPYYRCSNLFPTKLFHSILGVQRIHRCSFLDSF